MWQPIESAPRDGTMVLAYNAAHGEMTVVGWYQPDDGEGHWDDVGNKNQCPSIHCNADYFQFWMPLPEPPK